MKVQLGLSVISSGDKDGWEIEENCRKMRVGGRESFRIVMKCGRVKSGKKVRGTDILRSRAREDVVLRAETLKK